MKTIFGFLFIFGFGLFLAITVGIWEFENILYKAKILLKHVFIDKIHEYGQKGLY